MQEPLNICFGAVEPSLALETKIKEKVSKLERFCADIISCNVTLDKPHRHSHKGEIYSVHLVIHVPGREIAINRSPDECQEHEDVYVAIRDAFEKAERLLREYVQLRRGQVKSHAQP
ncbi:MAG: ribosome-associated translation inhibitor RaiA [Deltaproteobacteria bacterium]|nr:ribosome-associated translation inhibitor RaiA [Deltaproteobacteria bacterium]